MAVTKSKKTAQLKNLKSLLEKAQSVILADYTGLSVNQTNELRQKLNEAQGTLTVAKNSLLEKSLKDSGLIKDPALAGQSALITSSGDYLTLIKSLFSFIKMAELPKVIFGFVEGQRLELAEIKALSEIPSREVLLRRLLGSLKSPMSKLVIAFSEIAKKKS